MSAPKNPPRPKLSARRLFLQTPDAGMAVELASRDAFHRILVAAHASWVSKLTNDPASHYKLEGVRTFIDELLTIGEPTPDRPTVPDGQLEPQ